MPEEPMMAYLWHSIEHFNLTTFLAVWGALLSSITFGWALYKDLRDKAKVKVSAKLMRIVQRDGDGAFFASEPGLNIAQASEQLYVIVSVVNVGRRRMRWKGLGGKYRKPVEGKSGFVISARALPRILEEQEALDEYTELDDRFIDGNLKRLYIWDGVGGEWQVPTKDMRRIAADAKKYAKSELDSAT